MTGSGQPHSPGGDPWELALKSAFGKPLAPSLSAPNGIRDRGSRDGESAHDPTQGDPLEDPLRLPMRLDADLLEGAGPGARPGHDTRARYVVESELGRGGNGIVLRAFDSELGRPVAIKALADLDHVDSLAVRRFVDEARIGSQLQHPGIVPVHELGLDRSNRPFFVMKLVSGRTLAAILEESPAEERDQSELVQTITRLAETIAYCHRHGVLHRDLKPDNVMVGPFGEVQVMDWGMAKVLDKESMHPEGPGAASEPPRPNPIHSWRHDTRHGGSVRGTVFGTPSYMPPEQAQGAVNQVDRRADVFALGAILCEALTGAPPYPGGRRATLATAAEGSLAAAHDRLRALPVEPGLIELCVRCLQPNPADRPADAGEVALHLADLRASAEQRLQEAQLQATAAEARAHAERRLRKTQAWMVGLAGCTVVAVGGALLWADHASRTGRIAADRAVTQLMQQAEQHASEDRWNAAITALDEARRRQPEGSLELQAAWAQGDSRMRERHQLAVETERQAAREADLRAQLHRIMTPSTDLPLGDPSDYPEVFARFGMKVPEGDADSAKAAFLSFSKGTQRTVLQALDHWVIRSWARDPGGTHHPEMKQWQSVVAWAQELDQDPVRHRLRAAVVANRGRELVSIAESTLVQTADETTIDLLAMALYRAGERDHALEVLRTACRAGPGRFWIHVHLATVLADTGLSSRRRNPGSSEAQKNEAVHHAEIAQALQPDSPFADQFLALILQQTGQVEQALGVLDRAIARHPDASALRVDRATVYVRQRRGGDAVADVEHALEIDSNHRRAAMLLQLLRTYGHGTPDQPPAEVAAMARDRLAKDPGQLHPQGELARALFELGDLEGAAATAWAALGQDPNRPDLFPLLVQTELALGRYDRAGQLLAGPGIPKTSLKLRAAADILRRLESAAGAARDYTDFGVLPTSRDARFALGLRFAHSGRPIEAATAWTSVGGIRKRGKALPIAEMLTVREVVAALVSAASAPDTPRELATAAGRYALDIVGQVLRRTERSRMQRDSVRRGPHTGSMRLHLRALRYDQRLAATRNAAAAEGLPPSQSETWQELWHAVDRELQSGS